MLIFCILGSLCLSFADCLAQPAAANSSDTLRLCFVSDTQEPMVLERLIGEYNRNAEARSLLFKEVPVLQPRAVFHLGDLVSRGTDGDAWKEIDTFVGNLRDARIEFFPIPGNHEYLLTSKRGIANFLSRYPHIPVSGYARRFNNLAVVLFNSNFDELTDEERREQLKWYRATLENLEADSSIDVVVVGCHHPPYTNSIIVSGSEEVRRNYVPEFMKSRKCRLFLSGHSHAFERFSFDGREFIVIGGGGGVQHPLRIGKRAQYKDSFSDSLERRMFHFLTMTAGRNTWTVEVNMLQQDFTGFERIPLISVAGQ